MRLHLALALLVLASCAHQPRVRDLCDVALEVCEAIPPRCAPTDPDCHEP